VRSKKKYEIISEHTHPELLIARGKRINHNLSQSKLSYLKSGIPFATSVAPYSLGPEKNIAMNSK
jgi:hypothetical protein